MIDKQIIKLTKDMTLGRAKLISACATKNCALLNVCNTIAKQPKNNTKTKFGPLG